LSTWKNRGRRNPLALHLRKGLDLVPENQALG
jgi:hypothetical protein